MSSLARKMARNRAKRAAWPKPRARASEKLEAVAIMREGVLHRQFKHGGHWQIRLDLGDANPNASNPSDVEGFVTTQGRFVDRGEGQEIALAAGQIRQRMGRPMLSSDLDW